MRRETVMADDKKSSGRPDLDLDFTFHATGELEYIDVSNRNSFKTRLDGAKEEFKEGVSDALDNLTMLKQREKNFEIEKAAAEATQNTEAQQKLERQIKQNNLMIDSRTQELQVAYYVGKKGQSFDAVNEFSQSGKGRTDVVTDETIIECTVGKNPKNSRQIQDHKNLAAETDRTVILDAFNMKEAGLRNAERKGVVPARDRESLHRAVREEYKSEEAEVPQGQILEDRIKRAEARAAEVIARHKAVREENAQESHKQETDNSRVAENSSSQGLSIEDRTIRAEVKAAEVIAEHKAAREGKAQEPYKQKTESLHVSEGAKQNSAEVAQDHTKVQEDQRAEHTQERSQDTKAKKSHSYDQDMSFG